MTIAVDFDGVIHTYERGWADGSIYGDFTPGAMPALLALLERDAVFVHTTRNARQVAHWIERTSGYNIDCTTRLPRTWYGRRKPFWNTRGLLLITNRKLPATAYLDDRAVRFHDWDQALTALGVTSRLLDCGFCYEEWGEEVHPHPECPVTAPEGEQAAPVDWQAVVRQRERELKAVGGQKYAAEQERDGAYRERNRLVALAAGALGGQVVRAPAPDVDEPGWQILYGILNGRQCSWRFGPRDADLIEHFEQVAADDPRAQWDGHTTEARYELIDAMARSFSKSDPFGDR